MNLFYFIYSQNLSKINVYRAAAQTGKEAFDRALTDCRKALEIDPDYSKAYSRMG